MRVLLLLITSCATACAARTNDLGMVTTCTTNASGSLSTREIFTRAGQTNLVRITTTKDGTVQIQIHRFFHDGQKIGMFVATSDSSGFTTEAGCPYVLSFQFWPSKEVRSAAIGTKGGVLLDAFTCTNGVFSPAESSVIQKANAIGADVKELFDPKHVAKTSPEDFVHEVEGLVQKHGGQMMRIKAWSNYPAAGNAGAVFQLTVERHWPGMPEPERWAD